MVVVDKSSTMAESNRRDGPTKWSLAQRAVLDILDTFTFTDFVNVVTFSDDAAPLWNSSGLVRGRTESIRELKHIVSSR